MERKLYCVECNKTRSFSTGSDHKQSSNASDFLLYHAKRTSFSHSNGLLQNLKSKFVPAGETLLPCRRKIPCLEYIGRFIYLFIYLYAIFQQAIQFSVGWFKWGPANNLHKTYISIHYITLHKLITITFHQKKGEIVQNYLQRYLQRYCFNFVLKLVS